MLAKLLTLWQLLKRLRWPAPSPAVPRPGEVLLGITDARLGNLIKPGDLLLFRAAEFRWRDPRTWASKLICIASRGIHSHCGTVCQWGGLIFCIEVRELVGGRIVTLESQVRRYPGRIDVYEPNWANCHPQYDRIGVVRYMLELAGCGYGWEALLKAAPLHLPFVRWRVRPNLDDASQATGMPFCSQARAMADRLGGGADVVPNLADEITEPGDLARSGFYAYRCTLIPEATS